jgi:putative ABC transport system substrate-binding protein
MKRRHILLAGAAGVLLAGRAVAQRAGPKFRVLVVHSAPMASGPYHSALQAGLAAHGFVEGKNLILDAPIVSTAGIGYSRLDLVKSLAQRPDAVFAFTSRMADAVIAEAPGVPLVFVWVADPVKAGLATDYRRPGGISTGVSNRFAEVAAKRLELLHELFPSVRRVAVVGATYEPEMEQAMQAMRIAARQFGLELIDVGTTVMLQTMEVERAIRNGAQALLALRIYSSLGARAQGEELVRLSLAHRIPAIFAESEMVEAGALLSYGTNLVDDVRRAADTLAKVLRGAKPGDIPIDQVSNFELAVNLKTARQLNVRVPAAVLARAARVIE